MKKFLLILTCLLGFSSAAWAEETPFYTFATANSTKNTAYATNYDVTIAGMDWSVPGNQNFDGYVRIGGKSLSGVDREIYSKTAMESAITKVVVNHGGKSNNSFTVNSVKLIVASDANFTTILSEETQTPTIATSTDGSFEFTGNWAKDAYYKIIFNVSNSTKSNYGIDVKNIQFFASTKQDPGLSFSSTVEKYTLGVGTFQAPQLKNPNNVEVTYSSSNDNVATVDASTGTVQPVGVGTTTITATSSETETYYVGVASYTLIVKSSQVTYTMLVAKLQNDEKYYAMSCEKGSGSNSLKAVEVTKENGVIKMPSDFNLLWTMDEGQIISFEGKYLSANGADFSIVETEASTTWEYDETTGYWIYHTKNNNGADQTRTIVIVKNGQNVYFKGYVVDNIDKTNGSNEYGSAAVETPYEFYNYLTVEGTTVTDVTTLADNHIGKDANGNYVAKNVVLVDHADFDMPNGVTEIIANSAKYTRDFPHNGWQSICLPFSGNASDFVDGNHKIAGLTGVTYADGVYTLQWETVETIEAHKAYIIKPVADGEQHVGHNTSTTTISGYNQHAGTEANGYTFKMVGTYKNIAFGSYSPEQRALMYVMNDGNFYHPGAGATLKPFRAYLVMEPASATPSSAQMPAMLRMSVNGDEPGTTGINDIEIDLNLGVANADNCYYDLLGRKVENPAAGVYIQNGKKVYIK